MPTIILILAGIGFLISAWAFLSELDMGFGDAMGAAFQALFVYILILAMTAVGAWIAWQLLQYAIDFVLDNPLPFIVAGILLVLLVVLPPISYLVYRVRKPNFESADIDPPGSEKDFNDLIASVFGVSQNTEKEKIATHIPRGKIKYVYFIQNMSSRHVKIGFSVDPKQRLKQLQTSNSAELRLLRTFPTPDPTGLEKMLHEKYWGYEERGEWYAIPEEELEQVFERLEKQTAAYT